MSNEDIEEMKVDRTKISVFSSFEEAEKADSEYWLSRTPEERLRYMEQLRRLNYGSRATERLQRVLRVTECKRS
jgi:hypothetical protein